MELTGSWVKVAGTSQCEPVVPPWRRHHYEPPASAQGFPDPSLGDPDEPDSLAREHILQDMLETWTESLVEEIAAEQRAGLLPGELVRQGLERAIAGLERAADGMAETARLGSEALGESLESLGTLAQQVEASTFALAWQVCQRGLEKEAGFTLADWMARRMPWADPTLLGRIKSVAVACKELQNHPIGDAVCAGRFPVRRAHIIVEALEKVRRAIDPDQYEAYVEILLAAAANHQLTDAQLRRVTGRMLELVLDQEEADRRERAANEQRSLTFHKRGKDMVRFIVDAPARQAQIIEGAITSRLAAPQTGPEGELDLRTAGQRRFDAFITVFGRGLACPEGTPQMPRATLFITMKLDDLRRDTPGHGVTLNGEMLSARQVRQTACEAEIIPVVLGGDGEILDFGRAKRLATTQQVKALYLRDGGCTFPACTVPAQWTIAHHAPWFSRGGATDLDKLALLCERHHTHVHQHDLECTIDETGVTWHVR